MTTRQLRDRLDELMATHPQIADAIVCYSDIGDYIEIDNAHTVYGAKIWTATGEQTTHVVVQVV
jgi:hypothetical protein